MLLDFFTFNQIFCLGCCLACVVSEISRFLFMTYGTLSYIFGDSPLHVLIPIKTPVVELDYQYLNIYLLYLFSILPDIRFWDTLRWWILNGIFLYFSTHICPFPDDQESNTIASNLQHFFKTHYYHLQWCSCYVVS